LVGGGARPEASSLVGLSKEICFLGKVGVEITPRFDTTKNKFIGEQQDEAEHGQHEEAR
jgi:hypothetical protein